MSEDRELIRKQISEVRARQEDMRYKQVQRQEIHEKRILKLFYIWDFYLIALILLGRDVTQVIVLSTSVIATYIVILGKRNKKDRENTTRITDAAYDEIDALYAKLPRQ